MKDLIGSTLEKIKKEHIAPESRWKYLVRRYAMWFLFGLIVVFGAISFATAYYLLTSLDWDLYRFMHQSFLGYSLSIFPYFWAILISLFIAIAFFDIRKTETGYRFSWLKISLVVVGGIILLGGLMSAVGVGKKFNGMMSKGVPYYGKHMMVTKESQWSNPGGGFLAGKIVAISAGEIEIVDLGGKKWRILSDDKTLIRPKANISMQQMIKIIGTQLGSDSFSAIEIRPWMGGGGMVMGASNEAAACKSVETSCPMKRK